MGTSNYSDEFKRDAVHQITVRGYPVRDQRSGAGLRSEPDCCRIGSTPSASESQARLISSTPFPRPIPERMSGTSDAPLHIQRRQLALSHDGCRPMQGSIWAGSPYATWEAW